MTPQTQIRRMPREDRGQTDKSRTRQAREQTIARKRARRAKLEQGR